MRFRFEDFVLDTARRELHRDSAAVAVEPQVFDLLVCLITNRDRVVSRDDLLAAVWGGRIVSELTLATRINAARHAIVDSGAAQRLIRTVPRKGFRFVGEVTEVQTATGPPETGTDLPAAQEITFCRTSDGVNLAISALGEGEPLLKTANWLNHLEHDWEGPLFAGLFRRLTAHNRFIRYDGRGNGLSDWDVPEFSFAAFERDLETVIAHLKLRRFGLFGMSQGAALAISYAARNPERVTKLVLLGGYARGRNRRGDPAETEIGKAFVSIMRNGWGDEHSPFARVFGSLMLPHGSAEQLRWFANLQRVTTSADNAARIRTACDDLDVSAMLAQVRVPTLVLHCRHDNVVPFDEGRIIARGIAHARFVSLDSDSHVPPPGEPAWDILAREIAAFLAAPAQPDAIRPTR